MLGSCENGLVSMCVDGGSICWKTLVLKLVLIIFKREKRVHVWDQRIIKVVFSLAQGR